MKRTFLIGILLLFFAFQEAGFALGGSPLSLSYAGGTGDGASYSRFSENKWSYKYQYHVFVLTGNTPQGSVFSQLQLEERDEKTGIAYGRLNLYGSTYSIELGDSVANFSDITVNSLSYQGLGITLKPYSNFNVSFIGGSRGHGIWGADVRRDNREKENFTAIRSVYYPGWGLGFNTTFLTTPAGGDVIAYGSEYVFKDLKLGAEYGSAAEGKAFRGEIKYQTNWLTLGTIYRDVDSTYKMPFDYIGYQGMKGTYSTLTLRPMNNMNLNIQSNSYVDRSLDGINGDPDLTINENRGDVSYNMNTGTSVGYSGWKSDRSAYDRGGISEGEVMYITQQFYLLTKNAIYYRFQPSWFEATSTAEADNNYYEDKNVTGINIALLDALHLNYEIENTTRFLKNIDTTLNPKAFSVRMDLYESPIMGTPLSIASSVNYRRDMSDVDVDEEDTTSLYEDVTFRYAPDQDLNCYVTVKILKMHTPDDNRGTMEQKDVSFGLNYSFNTNFLLK